ncbi:hypothetical protein L1987_29722 [Smallanthus sonchifolius]|uniref:Uncharacterized protein n=1 Tax=Smallanthus sonchifolius TaxID=185202 RepID=A0ACB9I1L4_9ASTR|nr:hypothetical protein L1987_29722 [Smallanthus sonchifolius]
MDEGVSRWKNGYPGRFIPTTKTVDQIEASDDEDRCLREWILDYITEETNFKELDWCEFVVEKMKQCKYNWKRCNVNSTFAGPLAIPTLIYVESTKCTRMEIDPKVNPLSFWNMINLKERQMLEIQGGGFGVGPLKALSSYNDIECDEDTRGVDQMKRKRLEVEKLINITIKNKQKIEDNLGKLYLEYPEDAKILSLKEKYENMLEEKPLWQTITKEDIIIAKDQISSVLKGVNLEKGESSNNEEIEEQDQETGGNMQIGESEENVEIGKTDMMKSNICGGDRELDSDIGTHKKMCEERLGGQEKKCADEQTDYKWTEGLENIVENEQLELDESSVSPCISQYKKIKSDCEVMQGDNSEKDVKFLMKLDAEGREYEASEESAEDQGGN